MRESLKEGLQHRAEFEVTAEMAPPHLPAEVLSTPSMIHLIENACLDAAQRHLDEGETTVGTHVNVSHTGPAFPGETVRVEVRLAAIRKRRLEFAVEVHSPRGSISSGSHERAVVELSRFGG